MLFCLQSSIVPGAAIQTQLHCSIPANNPGRLKFGFFFSEIAIEMICSLENLTAEFSFVVQKLVLVLYWDEFSVLND